MKPPISSLVARVPCGGGWSGSYLPVSTPCPSGDQTICDMPFSAHSGITSSSGSRQTSEYWGWLETNFLKPREAERSIASWIFSAGHSEKPMYRVFPLSTARVRASMVSSSGVPLS